MIGKNTMMLNQATITEAVQEYLDRSLVSEAGSEMAGTRKTKVRSVTEVVDPEGLNTSGRVFKVVIMTEEPKG